MLHDYDGFNDNEELDSSNPKLMNESRIMWIARGSGRHIREVMEMFEEYKRLAKGLSKMKGLKIPKKAEMGALSRNMNAQHMRKVLPPQVLQQIGARAGKSTHVRKKLTLSKFCLFVHFMFRLCTT